MDLTTTIKTLLAEHGQGKILNEISRQTVKPEHESFIAAAREETSDDLEVDDHPLVSEAFSDDFTTSGCWVSAWIWIEGHPDEEP